MGHVAKVALIWSVVAVATAGATDAPTVTGAEYDFGLVPPNATMSHQVWIRSGSDTVRVADIKAGCGCLTTEWDTATIPPGDSLSVLFRWQTRGSSGQRQVSAYLYLDPEPLPTEVRLSGKVVTPGDSSASIQCMPVSIAFEQKAGRNQNRNFRLTNRTDGALAITLVESGSAIRIDVPTSAGPGQSVQGQVQIGSADSEAPFESSFTLELAGNQPPVYRVSVPVVYGDFSFRPMFTTSRK